MLLIQTVKFYWFIYGNSTKEALVQLVSLHFRTLTIDYNIKLLPVKFLGKKLLIEVIELGNIFQLTGGKLKKVNY